MAKPIKVTVQLEETLREDLEELAHQQRRPLAIFLRFIAAEYVQHHRQAQAGARAA